MPRTTNQQHIVRYVTVRVIWRQYRDYFEQLPMRAQRQLHAYYQPELELTSEQVLEHRCRVSRDKPALPQQAGRAYAQLIQIARVAEQQRSRPKTKASGKQRHITARSVRREHPDVEALARALIAHALQ